MPPRDIVLFEDMTAEGVATINTCDSVVIIIRDKRGQRRDFDCDVHYHSARQLYEVLKSKHSVLDVLLSKTVDITLNVDYWTLYDCRDTALDDTRTREMVMPQSELNIYRVSKTDDSRAYYHERMHPTIKPEIPLTSSELADLRRLLLRFPNLYVEFSCTRVSEWDSNLIWAWIGVIRTFINISDISTSWRDKYGFAVSEFLENVSYYWGAKPARIVRLHSSDSNFYAGHYHEYARYIAEADLGLDEGGWRELGENWLNDVDTCGSLIRFMAFSMYKASSSAACVDDFKYAAKYFPNIRKLRMNLYIESCTTEFNGTKRVKVFEIPGMLELRVFDLSLSEAKGVNPGETLEIRIGSYPRLKQISCESYVEGVNVRFVFDDMKKKFNKTRRLPRKL